MDRSSTLPPKPRGRSRGPRDKKDALTTTNGNSDNTDSDSSRSLSSSTKSAADPLDRRRRRRSSTRDSDRTTSSSSSSPKQPKESRRERRQRLKEEAKAKQQASTAGGGPNESDGKMGENDDDKIEDELLIPEPSTTATSIGKERDDGNVEYKWRLVGVKTERLEHLTTQMHYRLNEGLGECFYQIGFEDDGNPKGLPPDQLRETLNTIRKMTRRLGADMHLIRTLRGIEGNVAELLVRQTSGDQFVDIRMCVIGDRGSGKSTLISVLTRGKLDDGNGSARMSIMKHMHEIETGQTSAMSQEILGFNHQGEITNYVTFRKGAWPEIIKESSKVVTFIDLAGGEKYAAKTTINGLTGQQPDYVMLVLSAVSGVGAVATDHLGSALELGIPIFVCISKTDLPDADVDQALAQLNGILSAAGRRTFIVDEGSDVLLRAKTFWSEQFVPVFKLSSVSGAGLDVLKSFLNVIPKHRSWAKALRECAEFRVEKSFDVVDAGAVVRGIVALGRFTVGEQYLLGPQDTDGTFRLAKVASIHVKHRLVKQAIAGQVASICLEDESTDDIRKGMSLVHRDLDPRASWAFDVHLHLVSHPNELHTNFQPVVHVGTIRQTAVVTEVENDVMRSGDKATVRFQWRHRPEYIRINEALIFREGNTKGIGRITAVNLEQKAGISLDRQEDPKNGRIRRSPTPNSDRKRHDSLFE